MQVESVGSWVQRMIQLVQACLELALRSPAYIEDTALAEMFDTAGRRMTEGLRPAYNLLAYEIEQMHTVASDSVTLNCKTVSS